MNGAFGRWGATESAAERVANRYRASGSNEKLKALADKYGMTVEDLITALNASKNGKLALDAASGKLVPTEPAPTVVDQEIDKASIAAVQPISSNRGLILGGILVSVLVLGGIILYTSAPKSKPTKRPLILP